MAAALVDPALITLIDTLPSPSDAATLEFKKGLFYILGYCDTYHDFAKERTLKERAEGEGRSVNKNDIPDRSGFVVNLINKMDKSFIDFNDILRIINTSKIGSFENRVSATFTNVINPALLSLFPEDQHDSVNTYLREVYSLTQGQVIQYQKMNEGSFSGGVPTADSSLMELYMPAVVYTDATKANMIQFLKATYPDCLEAGGAAGGQLRIIEDTSSFPRNIFTGMMNQFKKMVTTQTKWDPAGVHYSGFDERNGNVVDVNGIIMSAPSSRSLLEHRTAAFDPKSSYFDLNTNRIKYGSVNMAVNKAGPSVNHIFMHMVLEGDGISEAIKKKYRIMITNSKKDSKKNSTIDLLGGASDANLRELTSSKRSGDYENIHSAIATESLMFTGDEPAFTYAVMNKRAAVFHSSSGGQHHFKLYKPPVRDPLAARAYALKKEIIGLVLQASELEKIFGATDAFYRNYLTNLKETVFSNGIVRVGTSSKVGEYLITYFSDELERRKDIFNNIIMSRTNFARLPKINTEGLGDVKIDNLGNLLDIVAGREREIDGLVQRNKDIEQYLSPILEYIPRSYLKKADRINPLDASLFKPHLGAGLPFLVIDNPEGTPQLPLDAVRATARLRGTARAAADKEIVKHRYCLEPGGFFPQYKYVEGNMNGIVKLLQVIEKSSNDLIKSKNKRLVDETLAEMEIVPVADINAVKAAARARIDQWLGGNQAGGHTGNYTRNKRRQRNNAKTRRVNQPNFYKGLDTKLSYTELHKTIQAIPSSKVPFNLKSDQYADLIVYRVMINDAIKEITDKIETNAPHAQEIQAINMSVNDPLPIVEGDQKGGANISDDVAIYCRELFDNVILPFFDKHFLFEDGAGSTVENILQTIIGGTYIQDLELMLCGILESQPIEGNLDQGLYIAMIDTAKNVLDGIFKLLKESHDDSTLYIKARMKHEGVTFDNLKAVIIKYSIPVVPAEPPEPGVKHEFDTFFADMQSVLVFIQMILYDDTKHGVHPYAKNNQTYDEYYVDAEANGLNESQAMQVYIKHALNDYLDAEYYGFSAAAPAAGPGSAAYARAVGAHGGSRSRYRLNRRKRGSPRRKSLRRV